MRGGRIPYCNRIILYVNGFVCTINTDCCPGVMYTLLCFFTNRIIAIFYRINIYIRSGIVF